MRTRIPFLMNQFVLVTLLTALIFSLEPVTSVYAASIVVTSSADTQAHDGRCTLREAIIAANFNTSSGPVPGECAAGSSSGVDGISFADNYIITLSSSQLPFVTTAMAITGRGAESTIIQAAASPNVATWRVFQVTPTGNLTLVGVTVRNGRCIGSCSPVGQVFQNAGGGIYNEGILTVMNSTISGNNGLEGVGYAGGIFNDNTLTITNSLIVANTGDYAGGVYNRGTLTVTNSTISENTASHNSQGGGGLYNAADTSILTVNNSSFTENHGFFGGGIYNKLGNLTVTNSAFSDNSARMGGGIGNEGGNLNVANSTFSGNVAQWGGGGISNFGGNLTVTNSTFAENSAGLGGGGIENVDGAARLKNTLMTSNIEDNCIGTINNIGSNLDDGTTCGWGSSNGSRSNTNPLLDQLADNGGPTQTRKLLPGSPAIDAGANSFCSAAPVNGVDQRGVSRPLGARCDIGAYETSNGRGPDTAGVFRPSNGLLYLKHINTTGFADVGINYGLPGDYPVVGDWDGNGTVTIGIYRHGSFYLRNSNTIGFADMTFPFGQPGDQPVAGDWNGDGVDTIGVYRSGTFFLRNSNSAGTPDAIFGLGIPGDVGIAGDWNNDGLDTTGVFRPSNGALYLKNQNTTGFADVQINYGIAGDQPVTGDWNADGIDTIGVYRNGTFLLRNSNTIGFAEIVFALGIPGDHPIAGNWDGQP